MTVDLDRLYVRMDERSMSGLLWNLQRALQDRKSKNPSVRKPPLKRNENNQRTKR